MRKLKASILDNLIRERVTSSEIDLVIWLSHYQNDEGLVRGVHYQSVCEELNIAFQTFYNAKNRLEDKKIIEVTESYPGDYDIRIVGNSFAGVDLRPGKSAENYINTGLPVFYSKDFFTLCAKEKLLTMLFIKMARAGGRSYRIGTTNFFNKYTMLFGVKKRTLQNYITKIRTFFSIGIKDKKYWITPKKKVEAFPDTREPLEQPTDRSERSKQISRSICRRFRLEGINEAYSGIRELIEQYTYRVKIDLELIFTECVKELLIRTNMSADPHRWKRRSINIKYLHKLFSERISDTAFNY